MQALYSLDTDNVHQIDGWLEHSIRNIPTHRDLPAIISMWDQGVRIARSLVESNADVEVPLRDSDPAH